MPRLVRVPGRAVPILSKMGALKAAQRRDWIAALKSEPPVLSSSELHGRVTQALSSVIGPEEALDLIGEVFAPAALSDSHGYKIADVAAAVAEAPELES